MDPIEITLSEDTVVTATKVALVFEASTETSFIHVFTSRNESIKIPLGETLNLGLFYFLTSNQTEINQTIKTYLQSHYEA